MRRDPRAGGLGHRRDLARLRQPADMAEVGLGDGERAQAEQVVELGAVDQPLAGCDRTWRTRRALAFIAVASPGGTGSSTNSGRDGCHAPRCIAAPR